MGHDKNNDRSAAALSQKRERASSERSWNWGPGAEPLVFFPPFLTGEMEAAGRHPPGALRPEGGNSPDYL